MLLICSKLALKDSQSDEAGAFPSPLENDGRNNKTLKNMK